MTFETWWNGAKDEIRAELEKQGTMKTEGQLTHVLTVVHDVAAAAYIIGGDSFAEYLRSSLPNSRALRN